MKFRTPEWQTARDMILFFGGLSGVVHETVIATAERPTLLILFAAMMGLPAFLRQDEKPPPPTPSELPSKVTPPEDK